MGRLTYTDEELNEFENMDCPVKINDLVGRFCDRVCDEFQHNCPFKELGKKLKVYEDKIEQGLLIELPVEEGSEVFVLDYIYECMHDFECPLHDKYKCEEKIPCENQYKSYRVREAKFNFMMLAKIGETVFLTRSSAEDALAKMKE